MSSPPHFLQTTHINHPLSLIFTSLSPVSLGLPQFHVPTNTRKGPSGLQSYCSHACTLHDARLHLPFYGRQVQPTPTNTRKGPSGLQSYCKPCLVAHSTMQGCIFHFMVGRFSPRPNQHQKGPIRPPVILQAMLGCTLQDARLHLPSYGRQVQPTSQPTPERAHQATSHTASHAWLHTPRCKVASSILW